MTNEDDNLEDFGVDGEGVPARPKTAPQPNSERAPEEVPGATCRDFSYDDFDPQQRLDSGRAAVAHLATTPTDDGVDWVALKEPKTPDMPDNRWVELFREEADQRAKLGNIDMPLT